MVPPVSCFEFGLGTASNRRNRLGKMTVGVLGSHLTSRIALRLHQPFLHRTSCHPSSAMGAWSDSSDLVHFDACSRRVYGVVIQTESIDGFCR
jgi:hypothetical protein